MARRADSSNTMMETLFGYLGEPRDFSVGDVSVSTLPDLDATRKDIEEHPQVEKQWLYGPRKGSRNLSGQERVLPYSARVFGLPATHSLTHAQATDQEQLNFMVWVFGFITGMRLTNTEAGFLDATPIKVGTLHDIIWCLEGEERAMGLADTFWKKHGPRISKGMSGVIHALFLSHTPHLLEFEKLLYVYTAIDGCSAVLHAKQGKKPTGTPHGKRLQGLCASLKTCTPPWVTEVVDTRNDAIHEGLFFGEPLGFSVFGGNEQGSRSRGNIILEMQCLVARFVCALLDLPCHAYIESPVDTRQRYGASI